MKPILAAATLFAMTTGTMAQEASTPLPSPLAKVAPALAGYSKDALFAGEWEADVLSVRDRALITFATLVTRHESDALPTYATLALDAGVTPAELSETITHLAFYAGWPKVFSALPVAKEVFAKRAQ